MAEEDFAKKAFEAAEISDRELNKVKAQLAREGLDLNAPGSYGLDSLTHAMAHGSARAAQRLVENGVTVKEPAWLAYIAAHAEKDDALNWLKDQLGKMGLSPQEQHKHFAEALNNAIENKEQQAADMLKPIVAQLQSQISNPAAAQQQSEKSEEIALRDKSGKLKFVDSFTRKMRDVLSGIEGKSSRGDLNGDGKTDKLDIVAAFDTNRDGRIDKGEGRLAIEAIAQSERLRNALTEAAGASVAADSVSATPVARSVEERPASQPKRTSAPAVTVDLTKIDPEAKHVFIIDTKEGTQIATSKHADGSGRVVQQTVTGPVNLDFGGMKVKLSFRGAANMGSSQVDLQNSRNVSFVASESYSLESRLTGTGRNGEPLVFSSDEDGVMAGNLADKANIVDSKMRKIAAYEKAEEGVAARAQERRDLGMPSPQDKSGKRLTGRGSALKRQVYKAEWLRNFAHETQRDRFSSKVAAAGEIDQQLAQHPSFSADDFQRPGHPRNQEIADARDVTLPGGGKIPGELAQSFRDATHRGEGYQDFGKNAVPHQEAGRNSGQTASLPAQGRDRSNPVQHN